MPNKKLTNQVLLEGMTSEQQKAVLDRINQTVVETKQLQSKQVGANVELVLQALKRIEADMIKRVDGSAQIVEDRVKTIKDGKDGKNGIDGKQGKDGKDGKNGLDGRDGRDGINGVSGERGQDGVGVQNAHIDFDGSLIIQLTDGTELNVGEVLPMDLSEKIRIIGNGGGTSQYVLDTLASLQAQIDAGASLPSQTGNAGKFLTTNGTTTSWGTVSGSGTVTSVSVSGGTTGLTTSGGPVTSSGTITLGGTLAVANGGTGVTTSTGTGSTVLSTSPSLTSPIIDFIKDTNGNEVLNFSPTASATDYLTAKNGIGVGVPLHLYADGSSTNIGLHIQPKGSGLVTISDGSDFNKGIRFRSSSSAASAITLLDAVSTAGRVVTLPDATTTLVGRDTTDTLTNKTLTSPVLTTPILGTPTSGTLTNCTGYTYANLSGTVPTWNQNTTGTAAGLSATLAVASGGTGVTTSTGTGSVVLSTSPTFVTPVLGTPTSVTLTNATGLPVSTGISGLGTGVATTLAANTNATGGVTTVDGTATLTNKTLTNPTVTNYVESVVSIGTVSSSNTLSLTNGTVQTATLTASTACTFTMPTATAGKSFILLLKQAASTGNGTATFTSVKWNSVGAPTITATAGKMDILSFVSDGTNWYGSYTQGYTP